MKDLEDYTDKHDSANAIVQECLLQRCEIFKQLLDLKTKASSPPPYVNVIGAYSKKGWENVAADRYFDKQKKTADEADSKDKRFFFTMMQNIGKEMNSVTGAFTVLDRVAGLQRQSLDLCMAPGGFSQYLLHQYPHIKAFGISLPITKGGHRLLLDRRDPRVVIKFLDITMLYAEMMSIPAIEVIEIPQEHPDQSSFLHQRPWLQKRFDLVLCDGHVLRTHHREGYREKVEATRLLMGQLILGLQRIKPGGNMVILLHKPEHWEPLAVIETFSKFSEIELFKPQRHHAKRSSFYLVAKNVQPESAEAGQAKIAWANKWTATTFGTQSPGKPADMTTEVETLLSQFGSRYVELGSPIWDIQRAALDRWGYCGDKASSHAGKAKTLTKSVCDTA